MMLSPLTLLGVLTVAQIALANPVQVCAGQDKLGAVASESSICSNIGIDLLKAGGNAADAVRTSCDRCLQSGAGANGLRSLSAPSSVSA